MNQGRHFHLTLRSIVYLFGCLWLLLTTSTVHAYILSGDLSEIAPPTSADHMQLESNDHAFFWQEQQNVQLTMPLTVDVAPFINNPSGFYDSGVASVEATWNGQLQPGIYSSFFIHGDKNGPNQTFEGSVTFDNEIIVGIAYKQPNLNLTEDKFGAIGTTYATGPNAIFELDGPNNHFTISQDQKTFSFKMVVAHNLDNIRIITASSVHEPSILALIGFGLLLLRFRLPKRKY